MSAVVIIDLMVSLRPPVWRSGWAKALIGSRPPSQLCNWLATETVQQTGCQWTSEPGTRPPIPHLPCLSKSPVNWNDCPADWKNPAPFYLSRSYCERPSACLRISHALFSALSSVAECTTPLITFLFDFTAGSWLCLAQTLWAVKSKLLVSLARCPRSSTLFLL